MKNLKKSSIIFTILSFLTLFTSANADIKVVASIKPIHSLVSYLMDGVAKPDLIVDGYASPHGFAMKPSHAKMLQDADIVFWVGEDLENFLEKPLNSIAKKADKIELMDAKGIVKLKFRERNIFDDHDDHGHGDHDDHAKKDDHDDHDDHAKKDDHDDHGHGAHAFEWAGLFELKAGTYKWSFAKVDGDYADPAMKMVILSAHDIEEVEEVAEKLLEGETVEAKKDGEVLVAKNNSYSLNFDANKDVSVFDVKIAKDGKYAFFTEHMPFEFEANEHFFKDLAGKDLEPIAQEPEGDGHDHGHGEHAKKEGGHDDHDDHDGHEGHHHGEFDPHIWLDPINASAILKEMTEHLIENDSKNASKYKNNLNKALKDIDKLTADVKSELNQSVASIVFHDAYQYFEERFNVNILGAFTVNTDVMPGAEQLAEIREIIEHDNVACVFSEPQFNPDIIKAVAKDMNIKTGVVDPLGATLKPGKNLYFDLIRNMSASFKGC